MDRIEITGQAYDITHMQACWADDETLTSSGAHLMAQNEYARLVNYTPQRIPGWSFTHGTFSGPARYTIIQEISDVHTVIIDELIAEMTELVTEAAAQDAADADENPTAEHIRKYRNA